MEVSTASRRAFFIYVASGTALAIGRITLYVWLIHRYVTHTVNVTVLRLEKIEYPEEFLAVHSWIGSINSRAVFFVVFALLLAIGSFILTSPLLLLAAARPPSPSVRQKQKRRV